MNKPVNKSVSNRTAIELTPQQIAGIVQLLDEGTRSMDNKTLMSLAESREQAVAILEGQGVVAEKQPVVVSWKHALELSQHGNYRLWVMGLVLLAILSVTFGSKFTRSNSPIDTDTLVLASELPPEAFANKEFVAWLDHTSHL
ncbi:MAG TPA: DUF3619 family protein [Methylophilaceae bacterium]